MSTKACPNCGIKKSTKRHIPNKIYKNILVVAKDPGVQRYILNAMFSGLERGTDIYDWLSDTHCIAKKTLTMLYGDPGKEDDQNCIYAYPDAAIMLIDAVETEFKKKIK